MQSINIANEIELKKNTLRKTHSNFLRDNLKAELDLKPGAFNITGQNPAKCSVETPPDLKLSYSMLVGISFFIQMKFTNTKIWLQILKRRSKNLQKDLIISQKFKVWWRTNSSNWYSITCKIGLFRLKSSNSKRTKPINYYLYLPAISHLVSLHT